MAHNGAWRGLQIGFVSRGKRKFETRNPKQIQIGGEREMSKTGGGGIREFREFPRILRAGNDPNSNIQL
jgi:hypothetical protein